MKTTFLKILFFSLLLVASCTKKEPAWLIGVSQCSDDSWRTTMNDEIMREASFYPHLKITIKKANDNTQRQIRDIEQFIADRVDLIIVSPNEAEPLTAVVEKAINARIPVVLVDRKISSKNYTAFVGADNEQIGREVGAYTALLLKGKGNIVEIRGLSGSTPDKERHQGFISALQKHPDVKVVAQLHGDWLRDRAKEEMTEIVDSLSERIDLVFAHNDEMATGVYDSYNTKTTHKRPFIIGIDALPGVDGGIQKVLDGVLDATFIYPTGGEKAVQIALSILNHQPFEKENLLYTAVVDKTNARVLKLQTDQIITHQNRIGQLTKILDYNITKYDNQRVMLLVATVLLVLILTLLALLNRAFRHKTKMNRLLEERNTAIHEQKEALAESRDQLLVLSKNLEESTQAKLTFFTNISHEFRTPLTLIMVPLERLSKELRLNIEETKQFQLMKKNVNILLKLIDQIIDFRRLENGQMKMYYTLSDLKIYLAGLCDSFSSYAKKEHIHFSFQASDDDFTLWFDSDKIEKICYNLISNAFKFTPENGKIEVLLSKSYQNDEEFAQIQVVDTGYGIPQEHIDRIFDRFYKTAGRIQGSGIGLNLTRSLIEQHNGEIHVESEEGKGTIMTILLPFKQKEISITEQYPILSSPVEREREDEELYLENEFEDIQEDQILHSDKPIVLLVEDNADMRHYIKSVLVDEYNVIEANNGLMALQKSMKYIPELILSDVMMDKMDGFELCKQVKENLSTSNIPVILLTACTMDEQKIIGFENGADAYIPKPFNEEILKVRIRKTIENKKKIKQYFSENLTFGERKESVSKIDKTFVERFRQIVEERIEESELSVDEIGKNIGLSRVQLYRKVKSLTNYSPNELVRIIRLKTAEQLMLTTEKNVSEIAYETGFTSPSYFSKCFKDYFNETPSEFLLKIKRN